MSSITVAQRDKICQSLAFAFLVSMGKVLKFDQLKRTEMEYDVGDIVTAHIYLPGDPFSVNDFIDGVFIITNMSTEWITLQSVDGGPPVEYFRKRVKIRLATTQ